MALSVMEIEGKIVSRLVERKKKDVAVLFLIADDGREILLRQDRDSNFSLKDFTDHQVKVSGILEGRFFTPFEIADQVK